MAEYYVSKEGDDSTGDGLSWATAWKTLGKAATTLGTAAIGEVVNIGPGRYTENMLWAGVDDIPIIVGHGHVVIDGDGGVVFDMNDGVYPLGDVGVSNIIFVNCQRVMDNNFTDPVGRFTNCEFWNCHPANYSRNSGRFYNCLFVNCSDSGQDYWTYGNAPVYKSPVFSQCTFVNTRLKSGSSVVELGTITNCIFHNPSLTGDYFDIPNNEPINIANNCFTVVDADHTINGYSSIAAFEAAHSTAVDNFIIASPFQDYDNDVFSPVNNSQLALGYNARTVGAFPYAHVLSPNVNSAAFAAPDHTDNVEQDGDVWKLTSAGAGVLSWYRDLGNAYNVTGLDVIGTITDAGHVWDTDNSDGDLTYLIKGSASPFTPVTSAPTAGVDGWQLANHGESISLASVRYVQVWIVPRTNGVS